MNKMDVSLNARWTCFPSFNTVCKRFGAISCAGFWKTLEERCRAVELCKESIAEHVLGEEDEAQGRARCFQDSQAGSYSSTQRKACGELIRI